MKILPDQYMKNGYRSGFQAIDAPQGAWIARLRDVTGINCMRQAWSVG